MCASGFVDVPGALLRWWQGGDTFCCCLFRLLSGSFCLLGEHPGRVWSTCYANWVRIEGNMYQPGPQAFAGLFSCLQTIETMLVDGRSEPGMQRVQDAASRRSSEGTRGCAFPGDFSWQSWPSPAALNPGTDREDPAGRSRSGCAERPPCQQPVFAAAKHR